MSNQPSQEADIQAELDAMQKCSGVLNPLPKEQVARVVAWLVDVYLQDEGEK